MTLSYVVNPMLVSREESEQRTITNACEDWVDLFDQMNRYGILLINIALICEGKFKCKTTTTSKITKSMFSISEMNSKGISVPALNIKEMQE